MGDATDDIGDEGPHLPDADIRLVEWALDAQDCDTARAALADMSALEIADLLGKLSAQDRGDILADYPDLLPPEAFTEMDPELRRAALTALGPERVAAIVAALESDDALDMLRNLETDLQDEALKRLSATLRAQIETGLAFPEDSAGRLMQRDFVAVPQFWTVGKTIDYLRAAADTLPQDFSDVFVITPTYRVVGEVPAGRLLRARRTEKVEALARPAPHPIPATMDQEEVAHLFRRKDLLSAPVVDEDERLIGVITIDDVVDVIHEEAAEDILRLAGVEAEGDLYRAALGTSAVRFRWLFVNLLTAIAASAVIGVFEDALQKVVALAILMPIVASMGGNAGGQALAVAVQALATKQISAANRWRIIGKEALVGLVNGVAFAVIMGAVAAWWFADPRLGAIIAAAMVANLVAAGLAGAGVPILLARLGADPAVASTVVMTTVTDIVGFAAFLGLAVLVMG